MAKDPRERFRSMDELCAELAACLGPETAVSAAETMVVPGRRPRRRRRQAARPPREGLSVWPLIMLLAGLALLAVVLAAIFTFTGPGEEFRNFVKKKTGVAAAAAKPVRLSGVTAYDPDGDQTEHDSSAGNATDGNPTTYWNTEHYDGALPKKGVGLVLDAGGPRKLTQLVVRSDTPGFSATIESGNSSSGGFAPVSKSQTAAFNTPFALKGGSARYYLVWITSLGPNSSVELNEVTAKGR